MTAIVKRLRAPVTVERHDGIRIEAADEIERLRASLLVTKQLNAELLAALERIADLASSDDWSSTILSIANAAIAKAKGETA